MTAKYGNRNVPKMIGQMQTLRAAIAAEGTPAIQNAWGAVEEHIDFAYRGDLDAAHRAGYEAARDDALNRGIGLLNYDAFMRMVGKQ